MAEMSMNRLIHHALRRDLARFDNALATFSDGDAVRARQLATAWANFEQQLTWHHTGEHNIAWPTLREVGVSNDLIAQWDAEHERLAAALKATSDAMQILQRTPSAANAAAAREAVSTLQSVATEHLDNEEAALEPVYLRQKGDPRMKAMGRRFGRDLKPPAAGTFIMWLQDGATSEEKAALRREIPGPIVTIVGGVFGGTYRHTVAPVWRA
jgi:hemerythrin-like domain-containing protein